MLIWMEFWKNWGLRLPYDHWPRPRPGLHEHEPDQKKWSNFSDNPVLLIWQNKCSNFWWSANPADLNGALTGLGSCSPRSCMPLAPPRPKSKSRQNRSFLSLESLGNVAMSEFAAGMFGKKLIWEPHSTGEKLVYNKNPAPIQAGKPSCEVFFLVQSKIEIIKLVIALPISWYIWFMNKCETISFTFEVVI